MVSEIVGKFLTRTDVTRFDEKGRVIFDKFLLYDEEVRAIFEEVIRFLIYEGFMTPITLSGE